MNLRIVNDLETIRSLVDEGFCPVECSLGSVSVVDCLVMDHHGDYAHLEAVSIRAYRDHFGARQEDPRFVVAGTADADATFAVAALAGLLPHPSRDLMTEVAEVRREYLTRDLSLLAETIALMDTSPTGREPSRLPMGEMLLLWHTVRGSDRDDLGFATGVGLWRALTETLPESLEVLTAAAIDQARNRRERAWLLVERDGETIAPGVLFISTSVSGSLSDWYGRIEEKPVELPTGWRHSLVIAHEPEQGKVTLACPSLAVAEKLFGKGGMKNIFHLLGEGWGGRESIGGSPRGVRLSVNAARINALKIISIIDQGNFIA
ncbi:MAG: hypothetical protein HQL80_03260 [Magnetococcales bacterium]|nr:hypothetical protein [Magnetococcales bacterium]